MTRLLVSVRSAAEAELAIVAGADLIDVKEPDRGSLGRADRATLTEVLATVAGRVATSTALGELREYDGHLAATLPVGFNFAKLGLAGCGDCDDWPSLWRSALEAIPSSTRKVAVIYADWQAATAPPAEAILRHGAQLGCGAVLVDTFDKTRGDLLAHLSLDTLTRIVAAARDCGMSVVLAGSLTWPTMARILPLKPEYVAVRGAVCHGNRRGELDATRVADLARQLASARPDRGRLPISIR